jgi:hypothetical protein
MNKLTGECFDPARATAQATLRTPVSTYFDPIHKATAHVDVSLCNGDETHVFDAMPDFDQRDGTDRLLRFLWCEVRVSAEVSKYIK